MTAESDALVHRVRLAAGDPEGALVLFHGRGADENDLYPLLDMLDPDRRLVAATPRGPLSMPPGGAHWYSVARIGFPDRATFDSAFRIVGPWLDAFLAEQGVPFERTVIGGFSQGTAMSHALALVAGRPRPAGVVALSGFIPTVDGYELDLEDRSDLRVAIGHGAVDPIIGVEWGRDARDRLTASGADVVYRESRVGHQLDPRFVAELPAWLADTLR